MMMVNMATGGHGETTQRTAETGGIETETRLGTDTAATPDQESDGDIREMRKLPRSKGGTGIGTTVEMRKGTEDGVTGKAQMGPVVGSGGTMISTKGDPDGEAGAGHRGGAKISSNRCPCNTILMT